MNPNASPMQALRPGLSPSESKPRLLLVEDDLATSTALRAILKYRGWEVDVAGTLGTALERLDAGYACVVLDLMLPDGNGVDVLSEIRRRKLSTPVIVTTGVSEPNYLAQVSSLRPTALLQKPINLGDFLKLLPKVNSAREN